MEDKYDFSPDRNKFRIEIVENQLNAVLAGLLVIKPIGDAQCQLRQQCMEELTAIQDGSLLALRRLIE